MGIFARYARGAERPLQSHSAKDAPEQAPSHQEPPTTRTASHRRQKRPNRRPKISSRPQEAQSGPYRATAPKTPRSKRRAIRSRPRPAQRAIDGRSGPTADRRSAAGRRRRRAALTEPQRQRRPGASAEPSGAAPGLSSPHRSTILRGLAKERIPQHTPSHNALAAISRHAVENV
jgi:hypothetical protein